MYFTRLGTRALGWRINAIKHIPRTSTPGWAASRNGSQSWGRAYSMNAKDSTAMNGKVYFVRSETLESRGTYGAVPMRPGTAGARLSPPLASAEGVVTGFLLRFATEKNRCS